VLPAELADEALDRIAQLARGGAVVRARPDVPFERSDQVAIEEEARRVVTNRFDETGERLHLENTRQQSAQCTSHVINNHCANKTSGSLAQWKSVRLSIERLGVQSTATE